MQSVPEAPQIARPGGIHLNALARWATDLVRSIQGPLAEFGFRLNRVLARDGSESMDGPLPLKEYTVATRPAASAHPRAIIFVSDAAAGQKYQGSDGSSWLPLG